MDRARALRLALLVGACGVAAFLLFREGGAVLDEGDRRDRVDRRADAAPPKGGGGAALSPNRRGEAAIRVELALRAPADPAQGVTARVGDVVTEIPPPSAGQVALDAAWATVGRELTRLVALHPTWRGQIATGVGVGRDLTARALDALLAAGVAEIDFSGLPPRGGGDSPDR